MISSFIKKYGLQKISYFFFDAVSFGMAVIIALSLTSTFHFIPFHRNFGLLKICVYAFTCILSLVSFSLHDLYKKKVFLSNSLQIQLLLKNMAYTFIGILVLQFFVKPSNILMYNRTQVILYVMVSYLFVFFHRFVATRLLHRSLRKTGIISRNVLAIGAGEVGQRFAQTIQSSPEFGFEIFGFVDDDRDLIFKQINGIPVLGDTKHLNKIVRQHDIDEIFITINAINQEQLLKLIQQCRDTGCTTNIVSDHFGIIQNKLGNAEFKDLRYSPINSNRSSLYTLRIKRIFDLLLAGFLLFCLSPLFFILGIVIVFSSKGPILYAPYVIGKNGKLFKFYKFRSMYHNISHESHKKLVKDFVNGKIVGAKLRNDPRVLPIGRFIRKYSLDEFAQLINVIKGEMSLVGPRPSTQYEYDMMEEWHKRRFNMLPGMTGLWQVSGRAEVSYDDMIMMDLYYIENCSFLFDISILLKTITVVLNGRGGH